MNIALAGFGQEGRASYEYWTKSGNDVTIADERSKVNDVPEDAATILGTDAFSKLQDFDLIIRSPSVNPKKLPYGDKVWSATNEFFEKCPAPIIGVTGTKGKGTTSSLIASILKAAGKTVYLVGNIGLPALSQLPDIKAEDIVVFEISSFQLWDAKKSPHVAVILGIEPDHLDIHDDMNDYVTAKANITRFQNPDDVLVYNKNNSITRGIAKRSDAKKTEYPFDMEEFEASLRIPGRHNVENACAAIAATRSFVTDSNVIKSGLSSFTGLPHRIKFIRERNGVKFYDDSYSSAAAASVAALKAFEEPKIIILGGYEKHASFDELARLIADTPSVKKAVLIGQTRNRIADVFKANKIDDLRFDILDTIDFETIVMHTLNQAEPGDVILLSPGSASFDMFKNFTDRGEKFVRIVESL